MAGAPLCERILEAAGHHIYGDDQGMVSVNTDLEVCRLTDLLGPDICRESV